jgi:aspartate aminotransferase
MFLSDRIRNLEGSRTVQFTSIVQRLKQQGKQVIDFAVGEPDFDTPQAIIQSTKKALDSGNTRYGPVEGLPVLRSKLADRYIGYDAQNILISNGSKQSLFLIFQVILNPSDEVIIPRPFWVSFIEQVKMAGGVPVLADTVNHQLDVNAIGGLINAKTRAIIINSPNNPTGAVYGETDIKDVLRLAADHGLYVISDEAYRFFVYDGLKPQTLSDLAGDRNRLIITGSFSKQYNMTGFRIGYTAADKKVIEAMSRYQSHCSGNVCTFAQFGALAALEMDQEIVLQRRTEMEKKRNIAFRFASEMFDCVRPGGAFYLFPDVTRHLSKDQTAEAFAADLLEKTGVAVVSGEAFGMAGHIRLSYAVPEQILIEGLEKISEYMYRRGRESI